MSSETTMRTTQASFRLFAKILDEVKEDYLTALNFIDDKGLAIEYRDYYNKNSLHSTKKRGLWLFR